MFLSIYSFAPWLAPQQHCTENHFMHKGRKSENKFARARARERERERERDAQNFQISSHVTIKHIRLST
jgi:hypothetical protein